MRRGGGLVMTALVFLFLAEAQRAFVPALFWLVGAGLAPAFRPGPSLAALLLLAALALPLIPVARFVDRTGAVVLAAVAVALFRLPMTLPAVAVRPAAAALTLACAGAYVMSAVGHVDRRAIAAGALAGLAADQLLRLAGGSWDLTLRPEWLPVQAVLSLGLVGVAVLWSRTAAEPGRPEELERRGGGVRLRGGIALAALLFIHLNVLGSPPVVARGSGVPYPLVAVVLALTAGLALAAALRGTQSLGRAPVLGLAASATIGAAAGYGGAGPWALAFGATGHLAALLLIPRALDPASGRRSGRVVVVSLAVLVTLTAAYSLALPSGARPVPALTPLWVLLGAGLTLAATLALLPRPGSDGPVTGVPAATGAGALVPLAALLMATTSRLSDPAMSREPRTGDGMLRVAVASAGRGYDQAGRFDPGRVAGMLDTGRPDVLALRDAPVGAPTAYGVDLPGWLARRLGARVVTPATFPTPLPRAVLVRGAARPPDRGPAPEDPGSTGARMGPSADGTPVAVLGPDPDGEPALARVRATLAEIGNGQAVVIGAPGGDGEAVAALLEGSGFRPVATRQAPSGLSQSGDPGTIWARGLAVAATRVLPGPGGRSGLLATLQSRPPGIR